MRPPIFGGWRKRRLTDRQLDALLRRYDWYWKPAPPIRWPTILTRWFGGVIAPVVRREP